MSVNFDLSGPEFAAAREAVQSAERAIGGRTLGQMAEGFAAPASRGVAGGGAFTPVTTPQGGREVSLDYAREIERRVNDLLAQGNIDAALAQARNITGGGPGVQNALNRINAAIGAASSARDRVRESEARKTETPEVSDANRRDISTAEEDYWRQRTAAEAAERATAREGARSFLRSLLEQYGLGSLAGEVDRLVGETTNELVIAERLRQTQEYRNRFKGLTAMRERGTPDITNEADYLALESRYRQVFREAGLRDYLGPAGTQSEYDAIARLVGDFSVSVNEVQDRISDAQRVVANTPQEVRDALRDFYNIDPMTLTQYVLDPQRTTAEIQRRANAAIVGGFGRRAGLDFGAGVSERIGEFLGGERDITGTQIEPQLTEIADIQRTTQRLAEIEGGELSAETSALSALNLDREARERVRTLQSRERARFGGRSGITTGSLSAGPSV